MIVIMLISFPKWFSGELKHLTRLEKTTRRAFKMSHKEEDYRVFSELIILRKNLAKTCYISNVKDVTSQC